MLRLFHTSDWHLGHRLHGVSRHYEHQCFLQWLQGQLIEQQADALIVAGDIFDTANPSATAQSQFYQFIAQIRAAMPNLDMVFIGGNHDSASRLDAPSPLLEALNVHMVGAIPLAEKEDIDWTPLCINLTNDEGEAEVLCAAMPFLRHGDLAPASDESTDSLVEGVNLRYQELFQQAQVLRQTDQAFITTGHCYMVNAQVSELSERRILGGNQHALPIDIFPLQLDYVALGHMHKAQSLGEDGRIRYSGSPIALSFGEANYHHQVLQLDFEKGHLIATESLEVPKFVSMLRLKPACLQEQLSILAEISPDPTLSFDQQPFLEVALHLTQPEPTAVQQIQQAVVDLPVRLLKISKTYQGSEASLVEMSQQRRLEDLLPDEVFSLCHQRKYGEQPSKQMQQQFQQLLEQLHEADR